MLLKRAQKVRYSIVVALAVILAVATGQQVRAGEVAVELSKRVVQAEDGSSLFLVTIVGAESLRQVIDPSDVRITSIQEQDKNPIDRDGRSETAQRPTLAPDVEIRIDVLDGFRGAGFRVEPGRSFGDLNPRIIVASCWAKSAKVVGCGTAATATFYHTHDSACSSPHVLASYNFSYCITGYDCLANHYVTGVTISGCWQSTTFYASCTGATCP